MYDVITIYDAIWFHHEFIGEKFVSIVAVMVSGNKPSFYPVMTKMYGVGLTRG